MLSRIQDHFPELLTLLQTLMRGPGLPQRKALVHHSFQLAGKDMFHHFMEISHRAHKRPQKRKLAGKEEADIEAGFGTCRGSASHQAASRLERFHALLPCGFPDMLENN